MTESTLPFIDSHCHIDMTEFDVDRDAVVQRARDAGLRNLLIVGGMDATEGHRRALKVAEEFGFPASAGIHPHEARLAQESWYEALTQLGIDKKIVAIGEIGLDFHYDHSPRDVQREAFVRQIQVAHELQLPVIVHTREADHDTTSILESEHAEKVGGVIHCFTAGAELADRALALGFFISFSGILTFARSEEIQVVARRVPLDRLLVETDAPFLAPPPHRGKRNEPAFVRNVLVRLAELRKEPVEQIAEACCANFDRLFRLSTSAPRV